MGLVEVPQPGPDRSAYDRARYVAKKSELIALLGGACRSCGATSRLEFDHIERSSKAFAILERWTADSEVLASELEKCQILCKKCHVAKTSAELGVEHGGGESGKKNCKCRPCKDRKNAYMRRWKRERAMRVRQKC